MKMRRASKNPLLLLIGVCLFGGILMLTSDNSQALRADDSCKDVEIIFARGSGQSLGDGEAKRFFNQLNTRINSNKVNTSFYELGTENNGGYQYPAVDVGDWTNGNASGAWVSAGKSNDYGASVNQGVGELSTYITQRYNKCKMPGTKFVLGGYSQGAQVVGQTLFKLSSEVQDSIVFVALFGDPKLNLPEAEGYYSAACRGQNFSAWRRVIGNCATAHGSLGARVPYLPTAMETRVGLWCNSHDFICGTSSALLDNDGHGEYKSPGGAIDQAGLEVAMRLKLLLPPSRAATIDISNATTNLGATGTDVVFLLNSTGWTPEQFTKTKGFIKTLADKMIASQERVRVAIGTYDGYLYYAGTRDQSIGVGFMFPVKLIDSPSEFYTALTSFRYTQEPYPGQARTTLYALDYTFKWFNWRDGANKSLILLSNAAFYSPDNFGRITIASIAKTALEIDPVSVFPIVSENLSSDFQAISDATSGKLTLATDDTPTMVDETFKNIMQRPVVLFKNPQYIANVGQEINFDVSNSYVPDAKITAYDWDFNGDGIFESTTTQPTIDHTYSEIFKGTAQVRAAADNGTVSNGSALVAIGPAPYNPAPLAPINLTLSNPTISDSKRSVVAKWEAQDTNGEYGDTQQWLVTVNGTIVGFTDPAITSIEIRDLPTDQDVVIGITSNWSLSSDATPVGERLGGTATATLKAEIPQTQPPAPAPRLKWLQKLIIAITRIVIRLFHF